MRLRWQALVVAGVVVVSGAAAVLQANRAAADDKKFTIEVVGVRTCAGAYKELTPFSMWEGTSIAILVKAEGCQVTGMDSGSRVKEVGDDTGADLFVGGESRQTGFGQMPQVAKDASAMLIELETPKVPTKGAKVVKFEGKLVLNTANGTESKKAEVTLESGGKFEMGGVGIEIEKAGDSGWEEMPYQLTLKGNKSFESIASWKFMDGETEIKSQVSGSWSFGSGADATHQLIANLGKKIQKATVVCECRKDQKKQTVPFKIEVGVGF